MKKKEELLKNAGVDCPGLWNIDWPREKEFGGHRHHKVGCRTIPQVLEKVRKENGRWEYFQDMTSLTNEARKRGLKLVPCKICGG